jgi:hypothetical protein
MRAASLQHESTPTTPTWKEVQQVKLRRLMQVLALAAAAAVMVAAPSAALAAPSGSSRVDALSASATTVPGHQLRGAERVVLASPSTAAAPDAPPRISTFSFSNGNIATFNAKLEFLSRYEFELYSVYLADKNCDARSVAATVLSQSSIWSRGYLGGLPYFYKNSEGCGHTTHPAAYIFESSSPVQYVYIALFAGNNNGHSSVVNSLKHYNPYY